MAYFSLLTAEEIVPYCVIGDVSWRLGGQEGPEAALNVKLATASSPSSSSKA